MTRWMFMKHKLTCIWIKSSCWGIPNGFPGGAELAELTINQDLRPSLFSRIVGCIEVWIFFGFKYLKIKDFNPPKSNWTNHRKKTWHKWGLKKATGNSSLSPPLKWEVVPRFPGTTPHRNSLKLWGWFLGPGNGPGFPSTGVYHPPVEFPEGAAVPQSFSDAVRRRALEILVVGDAKSSRYTGNSWSGWWIRGRPVSYISIRFY